jgi:hypothetical protein
MYELSAGSISEALCYQKSVYIIRHVLALVCVFLEVVYYSTFQKQESERKAAFPVMVKVLLLAVVINIHVMNCRHY